MVSRIGLVVFVRNRPTSDRTENNIPVFAVMMQQRCTTKYPVNGGVVGIDSGRNSGF